MVRGGEEPMDHTDAVNWETLSRFSFVYENNCWENCAAGCCQSELPPANFKFIKNPGTWIFYLPEEYKFYNKVGKVPSLGEDSSGFREVSLELSNGLKVSGIWHHCGYEGLCQGHIDKPLLCKLGPFLPVMDIAGNLEGLSMFNLLDVTLSVMGFDERCSVLGKKDKYLASWLNNPEFIKPLRHPYILFYLMAAYQVIENYKEVLSNHPTLPQKRGTAFWNAWEIEYVTGRLFDREQARASLLRLYEDFSEEYVGFRLEY